MNTIKFIITSTTIGNKLFQPPSKYQLTEDTIQEEFMYALNQSSIKDLMSRIDPVYVGKPLYKFRVKETETLELSYTKTSEYLRDNDEAQEKPIIIFNI